MAFPVQSREDRAAEEIRERIEKARKDAQEAQKALAEKADDASPEGAEAFKKLLRKRDEADACLMELQGEWERLVGANLTGKAGRFTGWKDLPLLGKKGAEAFVKKFDLGTKAFTDPAGAVLLPSIFAEDIWGAQDRPPPLIFPRLPIVRALEGGSVEYITNTVLTPAAAPVASLGVKPTTVVTLKRESKEIATIATVSEPIDRHLLDDSQIALDFLGRALAWAVARAVDNEIVNGDATPPGFVGLRNATGALASGPPGAGQTASDVLLAGIGALEANGYAPDLVILSAADWQSIRGAKANDDSYLYGPPSLQTAPTVWGIPIVTTPALSVGTAVVLDTARAARLYVRDEARLSWTESGAATELGAGRELFSSDAIRFRAETRLLLGLAEPGGICVVDTVA